MRTSIQGLFRNWFGDVNIEHSWVPTTPSSKITTRFKKPIETWGETT